LKQYQRFLFIALIAMVIAGTRCAWIAFDRDSLRQDPDAYQALAEGLKMSGIFGRLSSHGSVVPTAYRPPGYPWCLSWMVLHGKLDLLRVSVFQACLGTASALIVWRIAYRLISLTRFAFFWSAIAGIGVAIDPILLKQSSLLMTETLATFLTVVSWWLWVEFYASNCRYPTLEPIAMVAIGLVVGVSCLVRPTALAYTGAWVFIGTLALLLKSTRPPSICSPSICSPSLTSWFCFTASVLVPLIPWAYRNSVQLHTWTWTTTHGGYTLLLANNPVLYDHIEKKGWNREWNEDRFHQLWARHLIEDPTSSEFWKWSGDRLDGLDRAENERRVHEPVSEPRQDAIASNVAWNTITGSPIIFAKSCIIRVSWLWALSPYRSGLNSKGTWLALIWYGLLYSILLLSGIALLLNPNRGVFERWVAWYPAMAIVLSLTAIHAIYWSNMRMRAPAMPILYVAAIAGVIRMMSRNARAS